MDFYHLDNGHPPHRLDAQTAELPTDGFVWIDCVRTEAQGWERTIERLLKLTIDSQHVDDSHNPQHPSFFDGTCDYDMVIFQGLGPGETPLPIETRSTAMFIFPTARACCACASGCSMAARNRRARRCGSRI